jgi:hypothetical protein
MQIKSHKVLNKKRVGLNNSITRPNENLIESLEEVKKATRGRKPVIRVNP